MHPSNGGSSGGAVRESATFSSGRVGGGGGSLAAHGLDAPLRQLIEAKEKELHDIHDFRIRYVTPPPPRPPSPPPPPPILFSYLRLVAIVCHVYGLLCEVGEVRIK